MFSVPEHINRDNLNNARYEARTYFEIKMWVKMKDKDKKFETNSMNKNITAMPSQS